VSSENVGTGVSKLAKMTSPRQAMVEGLTQRQRVDLVLGVTLSTGAVFGVYFAVRWFHPSLMNSMAGQCYIVAIMGVAASFALLVSWLVVRPEAPGSKSGDVMFVPDPPAWFIVLRPFAMAGAVAASPHNAWAIVSLVAVYIGLFAWRARLTPLEGEFARDMDDLGRTARRGGYVCPACRADLPISPPGPRDGKCPACKAVYTRAGLMQAWGFPMPPDDRVM